LRIAKPPASTTRHHSAERQLPSDKVYCRDDLDVQAATGPGALGGTVSAEPAAVGNLGPLVTDEADLIPLPDDDFRRARSYLAPHAFATWRMNNPNEPDVWPPPHDLISREEWDGFMTLPTDVVLKTTSYDGSWASRVHRLASDWIDVCPMDPSSAPFMHGPALTAFEEFDALVFNAVHGWFRQALGCLRNVLEVLAVAAGFAVTNDTAKYQAWRNGDQVLMRDARPLLRDSAEGIRIDGVVANPDAIFGNDNNHWIKRRYAQLCAYTHGAAGHTSGDFWESNGPIYVRDAFPVVEAELRETLALSYLLLKIGWPGYTTTDGVRNLLSGPTTGWQEYHAALSAELL